MLRRNLRPQGKSGRDEAAASCQQNGVLSLDGLVEVMGLRGSVRSAMPLAKVEGCKEK